MVDINYEAIKYLIRTCAEANDVFCEMKERNYLNKKLTDFFFNGKEKKNKAVSC